MILLASAYSLAALTVAPNAGPTMIFAPFSCNFFIATRLSSGLDFESAINKVKCDDEEELISSKYLFSSPLKTFVKYKPENIRRDINVMEVKRTFLEVLFLILI